MSRSYAYFAMDLIRSGRFILDRLRGVWYRASYGRQMSEFPYQKQKFYEMVLYIAGAFKDDKKFGRIKLAKLIYNADFRAYRRYGEPISGATYIKDEFGHNPLQLMHAELDLVAQERATEIRGEGDEDEPRYIDPKDRKRLVPEPGRGDPNLDLLPQRDIDQLDEVIDEYRTAPAVSMSDESHKTLGWRVAAWKERIPYSSALLGKPRPGDLAHAAEVARARKLDFPPPQE
jgi:hypothetical protein